MSDEPQISLKCRSDVDEDGSWTVTITASGMTDEEARYFAAASEKPIKAVMLELGAMSGYTKATDNVTGEVTVITPETVQ
jgi:hypothetical protein